MSTALTEQTDQSLQTRQHTQGTTMTTTTQPTDVTPGADPAATDFHPELAQVRAVPLSRLLRVELRKLVDTRGGRGVIGAIVLFTAVAMGATMWVTRDSGVGLMPLLMAASTPQAILLPVLGIMSAANEWSQRTALITFSQEPRRLRVMTAKAAAAVLLGLAVLAVTILLAVVGHVLSMSLAGGTVEIGITAALLTNLAALQTQSVLMGVAFGALLLNVPIAIVAFFVAPVVVNLVFLANSWLAEHAAWLETGTSGAALLTNEWVSGEQWAQFGSATALWVLLPLAVGCWRVARKEVK